jgi:hypothetical protein
LERSANVADRDHAFAGLKRGSTRQEVIGQKARDIRRRRRSVLTLCQTGITHSAMPTVTVKMPKGLHARLEAEARRRRTTKSAVLREAFAQRPTTAPAGSLYERARHLIGSIDGPGDLSARSKTLEGYGHSRRP